MEQKMLFFGLQSFLYADPEEINFDLSGGSQSVVIVSNTDWSVTGKSSWINTNFTSGNGIKTVTISVGAYPTQRIGSITFSSNNLSIFLLVSQGDYGQV